MGHQSDDEAYGGTGLLNLSVGDLLGDGAQLLDHGVNSQLNAAAQVIGVEAGSHDLEALARNGTGEHSGAVNTSMRLCGATSKRIPCGSITSGIVGAVGHILRALLENCTMVMRQCKPEPGGLPCSRTCCQARQPWPR